jgi:hypothetical protein
MAVDFFEVGTVWLTELYVLFAIELKSRTVHILGVADHPDGAWATEVARNLVSGLEDKGRSLEFLVRDRDAKFTTAFDTVFTSEGGRVLECTVRSPRANAFAERWVGTVRRECTDHMLIFGRRHLEAVLRRYVAHYPPGPRALTALSQGAGSGRRVHRRPPRRRPGRAGPRVPPGRHLTAPATYS